MGHDLGQAVVVIAFDPHDFDFTFGIREFADEPEKFPVLFFQASKIEVGENVAQQNEAAITIFVEEHVALRARGSCPRRGADPRGSACRYPVRLSAAPRLQLLPGSVTR